MAKGKTTTKAAPAKKSTTLNIFRSDALELLDLVGINVPKKATNDDLALNFDADLLTEFDNLDEDTEIDPSVQKLMTNAKKAIEGEWTIKVVDDQDDAESDEEESEEDEEAEVEDEEESEEDEEEEEEPAPKGKAGSKPAAKPPVKKAASEDGGGRGRQKGDKKVGIIQYIVQLLVTAGTKKQPIAKAKIHEALCRKFPERPADGMKNTVNMQVPTGLKTEKNVDVQSNDKGYWLPKTPDLERYIETGSMKERAPAAPKAEKKPEKKVTEAAKPAGKPPTTKVTGQPKASGNGPTNKKPSTPAATKGKK